MKDISLLVGKRARNFGSVKKLLTNTSGGGTQTWIPEDEAGDYCDFIALHAMVNGTFAPTGHDGFSKVIVDVHDGGGDFIDRLITENGIYKPADDGAPGYANVLVDVKGKKGSGEYTLEISDTHSTTSLPFITIAVVGNDVFAVTSDNKLYKQTGGTGAFTQVASVSSTCHLLNYKGELYQFSWYGSGRYTYLSVWNGTTFVRIDDSAFPNASNPVYNFETGAVVVYHDEIYVLGRTGNTDRNMYKWDGSAWSVVCEIPAEQWENNYMCGPVVYEDEIHYFVNRASNNHYSWDGTAFKSHPALPYGSISRVFIPAVFKINDKERIHATYFTNTLHYSFNGEFWRPETAKYVYTGITGGSAAWKVGDNMFGPGVKFSVTA